MRALPLVVAVVMLVSLPLAAIAAPTAAQPDDPPNPCVGTMTAQPDEETLVSIQGTRLVDGEYEKTAALLVSFAPDGRFEWVRNASAHGRWWAYDVDRTPDGDLLFVTTEPGTTVVGAYDPDADEYVWQRHFAGDPDDETTPRVTDAHDADLLDADELVIADKGEGHERLLVYDLDDDRVVWEWRFEDHPEAFPESGGGPPEDWTHVNDVDAVDVGESDAVDGTGQWLMASVRNFDQVVFVNRSTGAIELTLGADGDHDVLHRQHNPDHLWGPDGEHTVLVADSLNDRVVEYAYDADTDGWTQVWSATGLNEPRDADRLPNGNTLVADRMGHRVVEITPEGEVVWEVYTPYQTYDAERGGPGSEGPTMREQGVSGSVEVHGDAAFSTEEIEACAADLFGYAPSRIDVFASDFTGDEVHRGEGTGVPVIPLAAGGLVVLAAIVGFVVYRRWW